MINNEQTEKRKNTYSDILNKLYDKYNTYDWNIRYFNDQKIFIYVNGSYKTIINCKYLEIYCSDKCIFALHNNEEIPKLYDLINKHIEYRKHDHITHVINNIL